MSWFSAIMATWIVVELPRLALGYWGNRYQHVSSLLGFIVFTGTVHLGIMVVYNILAPRKNSLDFAISVAELCLGGAEIILVFRALRSIVNANTVDFYLHAGGFFQS